MVRRRFSPRPGGCQTARRAPPTTRGARRRGAGRAHPRADARASPRRTRPGRPADSVARSLGELVDARSALAEAGDGARPRRPPSRRRARRRDAVADRRAEPRVRRLAPRRRWRGSWRPRARRRRRGSRRTPSGETVTAALVEERRRYDAERTSSPSPARAAREARRKRAVATPSDSSARLGRRERLDRVHGQGAAGRPFARGGARERLGQDEGDVRSSAARARLAGEVASDDGSSRLRAASDEVPATPRERCASRGGARNLSMSP